MSDNIKNNLYNKIKNMDEQSMVDFAYELICNLVPQFKGPKSYNNIEKWLLDSREDK